MARFSIILFVLLFSYCNYGCTKFEQPKESIIILHSIVEGKGIDSTIVLGGFINSAFDRWGRPDKEQRDEWSLSFPDYIYSYHSIGIEITTNWSGRIQSIAIYCNTGDTSTFFDRGLMWSNPSSRYKTFNGVTSQGLILHDQLTVEEVYRVYGEPILRVSAMSSQYDSLSGKQIPFIAESKNQGWSMIVYPSLGMRFTLYGEYIDIIEILPRPM